MRQCLCPSIADKSAYHFTISFQRISWFDFMYRWSLSIDILTIKSSKIPFYCILRALVSPRFICSMPILSDAAQVTAKIDLSCSSFVSKFTYHKIAHTMCSALWCAPSNVHCLYAEMKRRFGRRHRPNELKRLRWTCLLSFFLKSELNCFWRACTRNVIFLSLFMESQELVPCTSVGAYSSEHIAGASAPHHSQEY